MKKGFTLVELLAVIVILSVIALIATPIVLNMVESSRKGASESSTLNFVDQVEKQIVAKSMNATNNINYDGMYNVENNIITKQEDNTVVVKIDIKGEQVDVNVSNELKIEKGRVVEAYLKYGNYYVTYKQINNKVSYCSSKEGYLTDCESEEIKEVKKEYKEAILNGANPELYKGLVPIEISESGKITKADIYSSWYSYEDKKWANAVILKSGVNPSNKEEIKEEEILMYLVWVPRYKYKLFNTNNGSINPQEIEIEFENKTVAKTNGSTNGEWLTHPAFTFGNSELNGIWVSKFEATGSKEELTSKPGITSLREITVSEMFNATRNMELTNATTYGIDSSQVDTHMMKNMEWGAMAYLSHSEYGTCKEGECREITCNSSEGYYTGGSSSKTDWASTNKNQSTTLNQYGIYDTSGGTWEYVMGNMTSSTTSATKEYFYSSESGFTSAPEDKYIDYYLYDASSYTTHARGKIGDATRETLTTFGNATGGWYDDYVIFPVSTVSWFIRGGFALGGMQAGVFAFHYATGTTAYSFRIVLSSE